MSNLVICDIDGVLADCSHRLHHIKEKDYEAFYAFENMIEDEIIWKGKELFNSVKQPTSLFDVYLLTGRPERTRKITEIWLHYHDIYCNRIYMREDDDHRPSPKVKVDLMNKIIESRRSYDSNCSGYFIDDDPENVKAVCKAFPNIVGITFGIKRMEEKC